MMSRNIASQRGLTLVELLVSIVLMLLVSVATVALFSVSSSSYKTVDASQELQDNARFAMYVIGEAARSAGFQDRTGPIPLGNPNLTDVVFGPTTVATWRVQGANNAQLTSDMSGIAFGSSNGVIESDALVVRFFGVSSTSNPVLADGSMMDCAGRPIRYPIAANDLGVSAFYVKGTTTVAIEPELWCRSYVPGGTATASIGSFTETMIVRGVETFQVMYGVDTDSDDVPDRWLSANSPSSWDSPISPNWNNVVAIRVGMVLRGPVGSAQGRSTTASDNDYYPLGKDFTGTSTETGLKFPAPDDGRLRRAFATTFMLRNSVR